MKIILNPHDIQVILARYFNVSIENVKITHSININQNFCMESLPPIEINAEIETKNPLIITNNK